MSSEAPLREGQFTLTRVFLVMAVIGVLAGLARLGPGGFFVALLLLALSAILLGWRIGSSGIMAIGAGGALWLLLMWLSICDPEGPRRSQNANCMKQILLALQNYESHHRSFPPAYVADANGRPMHSWRVLLLPYIEQEALYKKYKFDEPWDGPNNRKLHDVILDVYSAVKPDRSGPKTQTGYVAITGPGTAWPGTRGMFIDKMRDGASNTIMLVEVRDSGIHWMEPRDLHVAQMTPQINPRYGQGPSSHSQGGAHLGFSDGSVRFFTDQKFTADQLRAMITADGGEPSLLPYFD